MQCTFVAVPFTLTVNVTSILELLLNASYAVKLLIVSQVLTVILLSDLLPSPSVFTEPLTVLVPDDPLGSVTVSVAFGLTTFAPVVDV